MAKRILTLCLALAIGIAFAMPASAAVKSIKVGGDLTIRGIYRDNLDFQKGPGTYPNTSRSWLMSTTRIWVGADLTDNVNVVVRLLNERDWDVENNSSTNIDLDLAYLKLKDLFVPGLSATLGRQEILLGKGFVVGDGNFFSTANVLAKDLSARKSFDALRLDYEAGTLPLTFTLFDAKIIETANDFSYPNANNDADLWGLNVGYKTDNLNVAGYVLYLDDQTAADLENSNTDLFTYGARIDHNVFPGLNYNLEAAIQSGEVNSIDKDGWAGNADVSFTFQNPMEAKIGAAWFYASGDEKKIANKGEGTFVPLYPDNISDRIGRMLNAWESGTPPTNISAPKVYASFKPAEKHLVSLAYFPDTVRNSVPVGVHDALMQELDFGYNYQYTEDVSFGLNVDYAIAGKHIQDGIPGGKPNFDDTALAVIGTVAVAF